MEKSSLFVICLLLLFGVNAKAQESVPSDSVIVMGMVVNRLSGEPEPYCKICFLRGADTVAMTMSDNMGEFGLEGLLTGHYGLSVELHGMTLYQADLVLNDNASLYLSVITDSFQMRNLHEVQVVAPKHMLGELQMTSPNDIRLWDMSGQMDGDASSSNSCDPNNPERGVKRGPFYRSAKGRKDDRIWQIIWPDRVKSAPEEKQTEEKVEEESGK